MIAAAALVLVGAGCSAGVNEKMSVSSSEQGSEQAQGPKSDIDVGVEALVNAANNENASEADREKNAGEVDADRSIINAYGEGSYELQ